MRKALAVGVGAAALLGGTEAFAPHAGGLSRARGGAPASACEVGAVPAHRAANGRRTRTPALRMGLGDMFKDAFSNNPNIPTAKAVGPGSPGFSVAKPQEPRTRRSKGTETLEEPEPEPPALAAVWQQATDPASGNPYWFLTRCVLPENCARAPASAAASPRPCPARRVQALVSRAGYM